MNQQNLRTSFKRGIAAVAVLSALSLFVLPTFAAQETASSHATPAAGAALPTGVIARVNGTAITQSDLDTAVSQSGQ